MYSTASCIESFVVVFKNNVIKTNMNDFVHFDNDGADYLRMYAPCPVCFESEGSNEASYWYHNTDDYGNHCGGDNIYWR